MSSPDDIPKPSKSRGKKRQKSRSSSSESLSQPSTAPVPLGERPSTSNGHESGHSRHSSSGHERHSSSGHERHSSGQLGNHHSHSHSRRPSSGHATPTGERERSSHGHERHSSGQLGNHHSHSHRRRPSSGHATPTGERERSSHGGQRPPTNMRDRLLVSNANALAREQSFSELDDTTSSSSPHMNGHGHGHTTDDQQPGMSNGSRRSRKKKKRNRHRASFDADLIGWTGAFPKLSTASQHLDSNPDLDKQTSDELRARCRRGLMVFPREAQGSEAAAERAESAQPAAAVAAAEPTLNPQPQKQSPSPMSSPIESSLSPNSELNRNLTPGPEPEPEAGLVPEPEPEHEPPTTLATTTSTNVTTTTTTTTARNSPNCDATAEATTATAATPRASGSPGVSPVPAIGRETELDNQEKSNEKEQKQVADPKEASASSGSSKRQAKEEDAEEKAAKEEAPSSPPSLSSSTPSPKRQKKSTWVPARSPTPLRPRAKSLNTQDKPPSKLARFNSRFKSEEALTELHLKPQIFKKDKRIKAKSPKIKSPSIEVKLDQPPGFILKLKATDPFYREPFKYGWKRELVLPSRGNPNRRTGDVFFISPCGRKMRSREEILPLLEGDLTIENFCFQRQAQEAGPKYELVRRATPSVQRSRLHETGQEHPSVTGKRVPKPKVPKGASPPSEGWTATTAVKGKSRMLGSASNGSGSGASGSRKRGTLSKQPSKTSNSDAPPHCMKCLAPVQGDSCLNCSKPEKEKEPETSEASVEPSSLLAKQLTLNPVVVQPPYPYAPLYRPPLAEGEEEDTQDSQEDNEDTASAGSVMEIGEEIELPVEGQQEPQRHVPHMEVVVIGGRKAIAIAGSPKRPLVKLVPRLPDLTSYDRIYRKRIQDKRISLNLALGLSDAHLGVNMLTAVMKTMNMKERAVMSQVCSTWATVSRENRVWHRVVLRDTHVKNWKQLLQEMARHRTRDLDMMGVRMTDPKIRLSGDLRILKSLRVLRTDATTNEFLKLIQCNLPHLLELRTTCVSNQVHLARMERLKKLRVLRINMTHPKAHAHSLNTVGNLRHLTVLSLRGVSNLNSLDVTELRRLCDLEVLSLGSCEHLDHVKLGREVLPYLKALHTVRIENDYRAMALFPVDEIMHGVAQSGGVRRLELINVDVASGFGHLLASCCAVEQLLLTPKCLHNAAAMINAVMQAIADNADHLQVFRLGLVTQLLSATENLYKGTNKNVIPVQRPVPGIPDADPLNSCSPEDGCQEEDHGQCVAFLPVERLESILNEMMPRGCLSVAKVAMSDTTKMQFLAPGVPEND